MLYEKENILEWTLYPILNRLEKEGLIEHTLEVSPLWPKRKYYKITNKDQENIISIKESYDELDLVIKNLLSKIKLW